MHSCPYCGAGFSNEKLLEIHKKYCGEAGKVSDSDGSFSTEKIRRSALIGVIGDSRDTGAPAAAGSSPGGQGGGETRIDPEDGGERPGGGTGSDSYGNHPHPGASATMPYPSPPEDAPEISALDVAKGLAESSPAPAPQDGLSALAADNLFESSRSRLKLSVKPYEGLLLVKASGDLIVWTSLHLDSAIKKLLSSGATHVILEVSEIDQCDATGLGALLLFNQEMKDRGGRLALTAPQDRQGRFECIKGFTRAIEFFPSLDEAVKEFLKDRKTPPAGTTGGDE